VARLERELIDDLAVGGSAAYRSWAGLPAFGGGRVDQRALGTTLFARKIHSRRWAADLAWHYTRLLGAPRELPPLVDDGSFAAFTHVLSGSAWWDLPTDPHTARLGLIGGWYADPLATLVPDPATGAAPESARYSGGVRLAQDVAIRKGTLTFELTGEYIGLLSDPRALSDWYALQTAVPSLPGWGGPRVELGMRWGF
jgi:hypothetical protein